MQFQGNNARIPMRDVAARYHVHVRTIERWIDDPALSFPQPIYIRRRRYIKAGDLQAWEELQPDRLGS
jgi:hypothetical protein